MRKFFGMATALALAFAAAPAAAQAPFYQGKQLKVLVGFPPGGGTDLYGRVIADGLARHLEGKPDVVVQNMPGAGSVIAMNNYAQRVARDGTTVFIGTGQVLLRILLGLDGARAKISDFTALVATPMGRVTYASPATGIKTAKDVLSPREPLILGVPEVISTIDAVLGLTVLKVPFRSVTGYPGKADVRLALLRNEINLDSQATPLFEQSVRPSQHRGHRPHGRRIHRLAAGAAQPRLPHEVPLMFSCRLREGGDPYPRGRSVWHDGSPLSRGRHQ